MKHYLSFLLVLSFGGLLAGCSEQKGFSIEGKTTLAGLSTALLVDMEGNRMDSVPILDGTFVLTLPGKVENAYPVMVQLLNVADSGESFHVPVMVENGNVELTLGEYVRIGGTPLNDDLQEFLNGLQDCKDLCLKRTDIGEAEILRTFSGYYLQQIVMHRSNTLGNYIYNTYGCHLSKDDDRKAKEALNIK